MEAEDSHCSEHGRVEGRSLVKSLGQRLKQEFKGQNQAIMDEGSGSAHARPTHKIFVRLEVLAQGWGIRHEILAQGWGIRLEIFENV